MHSAFFFFFYLCKLRVVSLIGRYSVSVLLDGCNISLEYNTIKLAYSIDVTARHHIALSSLCQFLLLLLEDLQSSQNPLQVASKVEVEALFLSLQHARRIQEKCEID